MNLIIDQGNTATKLVVFDQGKMVDRQVVTSHPLGEIMKITARIGINSHVIYSTVSTEERDLELFLTANYVKYIKLGHKTSIPLKIDYQTPQTLGNDRIAGAVGAWSLFPRTPLLIIDMGTAITLDLVTVDGIYKGGNISPGIRTRFRALHEFMHRLPLITPEEEFSFLGVSTQTAICNGVMNGVLFELEGYINLLSKQYSSLKAVITGGDSFLLVSKIKNPIFAELNLVPIGLNRILEYNVQNC